jgi:glycosyltransferase involved in cell wall biosynthesis
LHRIGEPRPTGYHRKPGAPLNMGPMRVAFVDYVVEPDKPGASGLSDISWNMARELGRLGDDVHVLGPYTVDPAHFPGVTAHRFPLPWPGYRNILGHLRIVISARKKLGQLRDLDFIHAPEYISTGIIAPTSSVPTVLTTPGNIYERIASGNNPYDPSMTAVLKACAHVSARRCLMISAISRDMERWWRQTGTPAERVEVIPHGVDTAVFHRMEHAAHDLGLATDRSHLLYVGRLSSEKNVSLLIRAIAELDKDNLASMFQLHIVGSGPKEQELRTLVAEFGLETRTVFHGRLPLEELPRWYSAADAVVLPSVSEGLPRVMLEAMACGTPFIGTRISGVVDHIRDGENGFVVAPNDVHALAVRLNLVREQPIHVRQVGRNGQDYVDRELTWPLVVRRFRDAVTSRLRRQAPGP